MNINSVDRSRSRENFDPPESVLQSNIRRNGADHRDQFGGSDVAANFKMFDNERTKFLSTARAWLTLTTKEGMDYGDETRQERIENAKYWAEKAGVNLEYLRKKYDIDSDID